MNRDPDTARPTGTQVSTSSRTSYRHDGSRHRRHNSAIFNQKTNQQAVANTKAGKTRDPAAERD